MAGLPIFTAEIGIPGGGTLYMASGTYASTSTDTPASTLFEDRIGEDVSFERSIGTAFWGTRPRGAQSFGRVRLVNADGRFDTYVGQSFRDQTVVLRRGENLDAYATFTVVATLVVDRIDFPDDGFLDVYVKDLSARLERPLQSSLYPTTVSNQALRGRPRPITLGTCFQVPVQQPDMFGNGHFDVHDADDWVGITQWLDQGRAMIEGSAGYRRSSKSGIFGVERTSAVGGAQRANVQGRYRLLSTELSDDFTSLAGWTELGGGVAGRDASIVGNALNMVNTAGGGDLIVVSTTTITASPSDLFFYEFDCTGYVSGSIVFRAGSVVAQNERTVDAVGRYTGVFRVGGNFSPRFIAANGSGASLTIDTLRIRKITLADRLEDLVTYVCTVKGPLTTSDLDLTAIAAIDTATGYAYGYHASEATTIADVLDQLAVSIGGYWFINRLGKLTFGRLLSPTGTAALTVTVDNISAEGIKVKFDEAIGLSNVILAKRNWAPYSESELVGVLNECKLNPLDKDADVALSNTNYTATITNAGAVRTDPGFYGERYYVEYTVTAIGAGQQHYAGVGNATGAVLNSYPGADGNSIGYRANGQSVSGGTPSAFGAAWAANDVIGIYIDGRPAAMGANQQHFRVYWRRNGAWQNSADPDADTGWLTFGGGVEGVAHFMLGGNAAETNTGTINLGQSPFTYTPPADALAPAWHRQALLQDFRFRYESTNAVTGAYAHADGSRGRLGRADNSREYANGIPTLLAREANARAECDRWCGDLYDVERYFAELAVLLDSGVAADQLEPGLVVDITFPRFGFTTARKTVATKIAGSLLGRQVSLTTWS
jgi:hypothetical protein